MNATLSSATLSTQWLHQMGAGATKAGVTVQYCMAYGRHTVASAEIGSVNQIRASDDYATGKSLSLSLSLSVCVCVCVRARARACVFLAADQFRPQSVL